MPYALPPLRRVIGDSTQNSIVFSWYILLVNLETLWGFFRGKKEGLYQVLACRTIFFAVPPYPLRLTPSPLIAVTSATPLKIVLYFRGIYC